MFLDYLGGKEEELKNKIYEKKKELDSFSFELKQNRRFQELLEKEQSTPFTEFTPQVITATEKKMQNDLTDQERNLSNNKDRLEKEISVLENELEDISDAIKDAKDTIRYERSLRKEDSEAIKAKLEKIAKDGQYNPAKAINTLRKYLQEL